MRLSKISNRVYTFFMRQTAFLLGLSLLLPAWISGQSPAPARLVELIEVPGGIYNNPARHEIKGFLLGKTEVTQEQFFKVLGRKPSYFPLEGAPVESVSWRDALEFCNALSQLEGLKPVYDLSQPVPAVRPANGYRLPTSIEWEWAAVGAIQAGGTKFAGSNEALAVAWYEKNSYSRTQRVAQLLPNELGLFDMSGNVWEWCQDAYEAADPDTGEVRQYRINRGGSWHDFEADLRPAIFNYCYPEFAGIDLGFRVARDLDSP